MLVWYFGCDIWGFLGLEGGVLECWSGTFAGISGVSWALKEVCQNIGLIL